ncbi:MAG: hypothetical protein JWM87_2627 [Candidatus Eremiobacteraeota bacterium]|nr:hypothetical protein [Candidatus Eremiobacteraeota bacterium]
MRYPFVCVLAAAVLAAGCPALSVAAAEKGPPLLTPVASRDLGDACPGSERYAQGLLKGLTADEADAAVPLLGACAAQVRLPGFKWKTDVATLGFAAAQLTRGLLNHDQTLLRRAASLTSDMRSRSFARDDQVRAWTEIPDGFSPNADMYFNDYYPLATNNASGERPEFGFGPWIQDAAYIHVAANLGDAWIRTPRIILGYVYSGAYFDRQPALYAPAVPNRRDGPVRVSE